MRRATLATIESSPHAGQSRAELSSRAPILIFATIFIIAAIAYSFRLGTDSLGASEAYSAWAAAEPSVGAIVRMPVLHDPGKQVFYYAVLHFYTRIFGLSEISLRSMSVIFSLISLALIFAIGRQMFDERTALAASAIWAFNPYAVVFAHTARMYPMFIAIALAHLLTLARVRTRPSIASAIICGILGAAMLYTHLAGLLLAGAECAVLIRDFVRGIRNPTPWLAIILAGLLFLPYLPIALRQSQDLIYGHSLDYLGPPYNYPLAIKVAAALLAAAMTLWLIFGSSLELERNEPIRLLIAWIALPALAFIVGSVILHPMFNPRYLSPGIAASSILIAAVLGAWSIKWRNLLAAGFALTCLILLPFARSEPQPWRDLAERVSAAGASDPIFFESGFVSNGSTANISNAGFPFGYYSVPFNYYFKGANPRVAIPGFDPSTARLTIAERVAAARGGWLVSWKDRDEVKSELPDASRFKIVETYEQLHLAIYRITSTSPK